MAGYLDTRQMIIDTLMGRPEGTQIQPEDHQAYALNMLNYIRSIELSSGSTLTGIAETDTVPIEPLDSRVAYIGSVPENTESTFTYFKKENNEPITIITTNSAAFIIFMWNTQYWEYQVLPINVLSNDSFLGSINVGNKSGLLDAISSVPTELKKGGLIISYYDTTIFEWKSKQYVGTDLVGWNDENNWIDYVNTSGGGGGGSDNYNDLLNKPYINGVLLIGNKQAHDFGLATESDVQDVENKFNELMGLYYGEYNSVQELESVVSTVKGYAYVHTVETGIYYIYTTNGNGASWVNSGNKFYTSNLESNLETKSQTKAPTTKAVADGIESVNLLDTKQTPITNTQKYNASANINNRAADVVPATGEVIALGYKVLNPSKSFAEQITAANTVYEIRDKFVLDNENTVTKECNTLVDLVGSQSTDYKNITSKRAVIDGVTYKIADEIKLMRGNKITLTTQNAVIISFDKDEILSQDVYTATNFEYVFLGVPISETSTTKIYYSFIDTKYITSTPISIEQNSYIRLGAGQCLISIENDIPNKVVWDIDFQLYDIVGTYYIGMEYSGTASYKEITPINIGKNSILKFNGGTLENGTLIGNATCIDASYKIFKNVRIEGFWKCVGQIDWWVEGCKWGKSSINIEDAIDEHEELQLALDSSFGEMVISPIAIYLTQPVLLRLPKKINLGYSKLIQNLRASYYGKNDNSAIIFTNTDITLLKITPVTMGKQGSKSSNNAYIEGGVFDVSLCDNYTSNAVEIISEYSSVWTCEINNSLITNKSSFDCPNDGSIVHGIGVYIHPTKNYMSDIHINANIRNFGIGVKANIDSQVNWLTDLYVGGYMFACLVYGDFSDGVNAKMTSQIQPRAYFNTTGKYLYPVVICRDSVLCFGGMVWDLSAENATTGTNYYLVELQGESRLKLEGLVDLYCGKSQNYKRIKGDLFNIEGYSVDAPNVFTPQNYSEDSEFNFFSNFTDFGTFEVKHYAANGTQKNSPTITDNNRAFIKRVDKNVICTVTLDENATIEEGDYVDIILTSDLAVSLYKSSIFILGNTIVHPFTAIEFIKEHTTNLNKLSQEIKVYGNEPIYPYVFNLLDASVVNKFTFRLKNISDNTFKIYRITGSTQGNEGSTKDTMVYTPNVNYVGGVKLISKETRYNITSPYALFPQTLDASVSSNQVLFKIKKVTYASFYYLQFFASNTTTTYNYTALYKLSLFRRTNGNKKITLEKVYGSFDCPLKIYEDTDHFTVVMAPISLDSVFLIKYQVLNPTADIYTSNTIDGSEITISRINNSGASNERPVVTNDIGFKYFDTTLGKPIYWNGAYWIDGNGETVGLQVSDTSVLISDSPKTVSVYYGGTTAPTVTVLNSDDSANTWLTATPDPFTGNTLTLTASANNTTAPRGAKVLVTLGDELVIINVIQAQTVSNE